jgi:hypothetical protein
VTHQAEKKILIFGKELARVRANGKIAWTANIFRVDVNIGGLELWRIFRGELNAARAATSIDTGKGIGQSTRANASSKQVNRYSHSSIASADSTIDQSPKKPYGKSRSD